ncbi:MAG: sulfatase-like hydrolase/transferase [Nitrospiraceae bacterium]
MPSVRGWGWPTVHCSICGLNALSGCGSQQPFSSTLTLATHHPFAAPSNHPDVQRLQQLVDDKYVAALRYTDLELERVFTDLAGRGLLRNTVLFVLEDHGRHEAIGKTDVERAVGHFSAPLAQSGWIPLRSPDRYRPRTVPTVASQVDVAPTALALIGLLPAVALSSAVICPVPWCVTAWMITVPMCRVCMTTSWVMCRARAWSSIPSRPKRSGRGVGFLLAPGMAGADPLLSLPHYRELMALNLQTWRWIQSCWSWREFGQRL